MFAGPDYSIIHPGIFPHNTEAQALATLREWLEFDHKAGWGTDAFENRTRPAGFTFPARWKERDDRADAADILRQNTSLLDEIAAQRLKLLKVGYQLGEITVDRADDRGVKFKVRPGYVVQAYRFALDPSGPQLARLASHCGASARTLGACRRSA